MESESVRRAGSAITCGTTGARIVSGSYHLTFPLNTSGANCTVPTAVTGRGSASNAHFYQAWVGVSADPSSAIGLLCTYASPTTERFVRIGTDRKVTVHDSAGNQVGHTSRDTISSSGMTHFAILYDFLLGKQAGDVGAANRAYVCLWVGGKIQWDGLIVVPAGTRLLPATNTDDLVWGEDLDAGVTRGCDMYLDDRDADSIGVGVSLDPRYMPHITARPLAQVVGASTLPPTANATHTGWTLGAGDYTGVDEYPNDGSTTATSSLTNSSKETYTYSAANPTDSADTIHAVALCVVKRETAGAKTSCLGLFRDGSGNEESNGWTASGTSHKGDRKLMDRPAGGSWVYTDFDLVAGVSDLEFGMESPSANAGSEITSLPGPEITKYETLMSNGRCWN